VTSSTRHLAPFHAPVAGVWSPDADGVQRIDHVSRERRRLLERNVVGRVLEPVSFAGESRHEAYQPHGGRRSRVARASTRPVVRLNPGSLIPARTMARFAHLLFRCCSARPRLRARRPGEHGAGRAVVPVSEIKVGVPVPAIPGRATCPESVRRCGRRMRSVAELPNGLPSDRQKLHP
jgi:hypothetical protein